MEKDKKIECVRKPLSFGTLAELVRTGACDGSLYLPILNTFRLEKRWHHLFYSLLLFFAISAFAVSFSLVLYQYFTRLPELWKLVLLETGLGGCLYALGFMKNPKILVKRLLLLGAFAFTGLLLFVERSAFIHSYLLVGFWLFLTFPFFFIYIRQSFLCLWLSLLHVCLLLLGIQILLPSGFLLWTTFFSLISLLNFGLFQLIRILLPSYKTALFLSALAALLCTALPTLHFILNISFYSTYSPSYFIGPVLLLSYLFFFRLQKNILVYRMSLVFFFIILSSLFIRFLFPFFGDVPGGGAP